MPPGSLDRFSKLASIVPTSRRLRVFTFDPALSTRFETALISEAVLSVPWEAALEPGPIGEYVEVIDRDPASDAVYLPVDLNDPELLAQDGLPPSEGNPQFHQQMVYAVAMVTIRNFERALGRRVVWRPRFDENLRRFQPVPRLRLYPHALREANAYYSPRKRAVLFGYFRASTTDPGANLPGGTVFTCLSHDIIAHETTHAILDAFKGRYIEPSNPDVLAFHEALADIVAIFQRFTFPETLRHQIAQTHGDLGQDNLMAEVGRQLGEAIGNRGALRTAISRPGQPLLRLSDAIDEPHDRGAILLAAVFDAFVTIYRARTADLLRLATGTGTCYPTDDIHPDLLNRLVTEATQAAHNLLNIFIRALDYCPPVDINFGEYLRAIVTADFDHVRADERFYRIALIDAFRRRAIFPAECRSLSIESLLWHKPFAFSGLDGLDLNSLEVRPAMGRRESVEHSAENQRLIWEWINSDQGLSERQRIERWAKVGLDLGKDAPSTIARCELTGRPAVEVHSARVARRIGPDGESLADLVLEITQRRRGYLDAQLQEQIEKSVTLWEEQPEQDFWFRGGCTLIVDLRDGTLRYAIFKHIKTEEDERLHRQREYLKTRYGDGSLATTYFGAGAGRWVREPLALLHRHHREDVSHGEFVEGPEDGNVGGRRA
jgi:hypothetical protein